MRGSLLFCMLVLVALLGLAISSKPPPPPARCLAQGACKYHAPTCLDSPEDLFVCDEASGAWTSAYNHTPHDLTIAGPVIFLGDLTLGNNVNITINATLDSILYVRGVADFTRANETIYIRVADEQLEEYAKVEATGSTDYSASERKAIVAESLNLPSGYKLKLLPTHKCHIPYLVEKSPAEDDITVVDPGQVSITGQTFFFYLYTKSQCWWWIVLVGTILAYFALLILVIAAFKTIPTLKAWTALPIYDTHMAATAHRSKHVDQDEYELDNQISSTRKSGSSEEGDSIALDI